MRPTPNIKQTIFKDFAHYSFTEGPGFSWDSTRKSIAHPTLATLQDLWSLLHEISHGELGHETFKADVELLRCETAAWEHAKDDLANRYGINIDQDYIEDHLDTYRAWLHSRSTCPTCHQNGIQTTQNTYSCLNCRCQWRVNEARLCRLKRVKLQVQGRSA